MKSSLMSCALKTTNESTVNDTTMEYMQWYCGKHEQSAWRKMKREEEEETGICLTMKDINEVGLEARFDYFKYRHNLKGEG